MCDRQRRHRTRTWLSGWG
uniref:Uncharacterized protein n=1 Tax=Rhizophora mucronata TaxID=61149 RepID=A0A2P2ILH8_RHIMU